MPVQVRTVATVANIALFVTALAVQFLIPLTSLYVFYGILAWFIASIFVFRLPVMNRWIGGRPAPVMPGAVPPPSAPPSRSPAPLPSSTPKVEPFVLDFCPNCAARISPGTSRCPACGKAVPVW